MPSSIPSSAGIAPQPSVLLLEEYEPLAAAIGSALRKFAPGHWLSSARTLAQAEALARQTRPALFIVDVDPPWPGLIDFLEKLRRENPDGRVLVIGAAVPTEIASERGSFGALQFVEKPFELADFGAAIQALLGPWRKAESANSRGTLRALNLSDILLLECATRASVLVEVEAGRREYGEVHIVEGQIFHAEAGKLEGIEALGAMLGWTESTLSEAKKRPSANRTVHDPWAKIILELLRRAGVVEPAPAVPAKEPAPALPSAEGAKKIVVIDDTEMLLIFVADVLATNHPEWQITTASKGLTGCKEVERMLPDLVLLDYSLPDINGDEVCRRLLQNEKTAHIPVLMMSGHVLEMNAAAARFENIVATIEKPFLSDAFISLVERTLDGASPRIEISTEQPEPLEPPAVQRPMPREDARQSARAEPIAPRSSPPPLSPRQEAVAIKSAPPATAISAPVIAAAKEAILGLFLDVLSMQFTPQLQMGTIRAKPSSKTVSLHLPSGASRDSLPVETGFELGRTELDPTGHIATLRLIPTLKPFQPAKIRNAFEISDVAVVPGAARERVQLTPTMAAPMTMQLLARLDMAGVELSPTFQVSEVVLKWRDSKVRVTFSAKATAGESNGAAFEIAVVQLDAAGRIDELLLNPIR